MKALTKKTLSVVFALILAVSSLTITSMSAFAADASQFTAAVGEGSTKLATTKFKFTPSQTANYNISLSTIKNNKGVRTYYSYSSDIENFDASNAEHIYSSSFEITRANTEGELPTGTVRETTYTPAQTTVKLIAGTTYYFETVDTAIGENIASTITIAKNDFQYSFDAISSDLSYVSSYNYNEKTGKYDIPVKDTVYTETGISANVDRYVGTDKTVAVPANFLGYAVKDVTLYADSLVNKKITSVVIPEGVEAVGGMSYMYALTSVTLPSSLKTIRENAFEGDHALSGRLVIPANVTAIGRYAFYDTGYSSAQILGTNTQIGEFALGYKEVLNEATENPRDTISAPVKDFFIVAPAASLATSYAAQNGFAAYDPANCTSGKHSYKVTTVKATVFAKGSTTSVCPVCGNKVVTSSKKKTFKISSVKSTKKRTIVVKAPKQTSMTGYQVQYSTSKKFTKKATKTSKVATKKALNKTVKSLKSGKKYYVRVRAYKTSKGKTVYSSWTATKSVKVK